MAQVDDNGAKVMYGVSHLDGVTSVLIKFTSSREMMVDTTTAIAFDPSIIETMNRLTGRPLATATSSADNKTIAPWVVNASTGAVLIAT